MTMSGRQPTVERVESVSSGERVRDYDELDENAQTALVKLVNETRPDDGEFVAKLTGDLVRFTGYYRVRRVDSTASD